MRVWKNVGSVFRCLMSDVRCRMLDVGFGMLDLGCLKSNLRLLFTINLLPFSNFYPEQPAPPAAVEVEGNDFPLTLSAARQVFPNNH